MDRKDARALAQATLEATGSYQAFYKHEPDSFGGQSPVAVVHSKSLQVVSEARNLVNVPCEVWATIYVRRYKGEGDEAEDQLDDLVREAALALHDAGFQVGPSESGYPPAMLDGTSYRMERMALRVDDDNDEE